MNDVASAQPPRPGELNLDHIAHFVPDIDAASAALERLGFTLTPYSPQSHRLSPGGPLVSAGTGNRCIMFERGYVEMLTPTAATPVADQLRDAIRRYVGVHLVAFGTSTPDADHARLSEAGFRPLEPVALQRPIDTAEGAATARFTVVRVPPGTMGEGRIQFCRQHTPELVWQTRWTGHPNGVTALAWVLVCAADPAEAARRYSRFTGLEGTSSGSGWSLATARGTLLFAAPDAIERVLGTAPAAPPSLAAYGLRTRDPALARRLAAAAGCSIVEVASDRFAAALPAALGGIVVFESAAASPLRL
jgi:hypothetical protein